MTTLTTILITWFLAGILANVIIIRSIKEDIKIEDIKMIILLCLLGYVSLFIILLILLVDNIKLLKFKLPNGDKVIWKYPKKD